MIYIFVILYIIICIINYDVKKSVHEKKANFFIVLGLLILISGLSYRLGSDIIWYMEDFKKAKTISDASFSYFFSLDGGHLPGWVFLVSTSKSIFNHFNFLKLIIAFFVNYAFFITIWRNTKYVFTGVLFYFVFLYFIINFEILRFSISAAIFLLSLTYLEQGKIIKYFIFVFLATLFHEGALLLLLVPLLKKVVLNRMVSWLFICGIIIALISSVFLRERIGLLSAIGLFERKVDIYMNAEGQLGNYAGFSIIMIIKIFLLYGIPLLLFPSVNKYINNKYVPYLLMFLLCVALGYIFPIAIRFQVYFDLFYYIYIIDLVIVYSKRNKLLKPIRNIVVMSILLTMLSYRILSEIKPQESLYGMSSFSRYYPYASIIDPQVDPNRESLYYYLNTYGF